MTAWTFSKTSAVGIALSQTWGRWKEVLKQECKGLWSNGSVPWVGGLHPKVSKINAHTFLFLDFLEPMQVLLSAFPLRDPLTPNWGQQEGEWINRLKRGGLCWAGPRSCLAQCPVPSSRYQGKAWEKGKCKWNDPAPLWKGISLTFQWDRWVEAWPDEILELLFFSWPRIGLEQIQVPLMVNQDWA